VTFETDISVTMAWIDRALDGLEPLTVDPQKLPPD
jgi:hypothetical protein